MFSVQHPSCGMVLYPIHIIRSKFTIIARVNQCEMIPKEGIKSVLLCNETELCIESYHLKARTVDEMKKDTN